MVLQEYISKEKTIVKLLFFCIILFVENTKTIGKDYSLFELARFALPAILNELIITLLYTIDDGLFISRYVGQNGLATFSILSPLFFMHGAISALFGGVSILVSRKMGEGKNKEAESDFTTIFIFLAVLGVVLGLLERIFLDKILQLLGVTELIYPHASGFMKIGALYLPLILISNLFMRFYVPSGKPHVELFATVVNVSCNLFFDYYFVVYKRIGMVGAAYANLIANIVMVIIGLVFYSSRYSELRFSKPQSKLIPLLKESSKYGISTFLSNLSVAIGTIVSNYVLLHYGNESYLAAYSIVNNIAFIFMSAYFGLLGTTGPVLSYAIGERNKDKLNITLRQIVILITVLSILTLLLFLIFGPILARLYIVNADTDYIDMISYGMKIAPYSFLFFGYNVATRMSFAALGNHKASAALTFLQELIISNITIIILPMLFGVKGVWFSFLLTNIITLFASIFVIYANKDNYGYGKDKIAYLVDNQ